VRQIAYFLEEIRWFVLIMKYLGEEDARIAG
jgi:hypothetical protein